MNTQWVRRSAPVIEPADQMSSKWSPGDVPLAWQVDKASTRLVDGPLTGLRLGQFFEGCQDVQYVAGVVPEQVVTTYLSPTIHPHVGATQFNLLKVAERLDAMADQARSLLGGAADEYGEDAKKARELQRKIIARSHLGDLWLSDLEELVLMATRTRHLYKLQNCVRQPNIDEEKGLPQ